MRIGLSILAGAIAFAAAGHALAGQDEAVFSFDTKGLSSTERTSTHSSQDSPVPASTGHERGGADTPAKYSVGENYYSPAGDTGLFDKDRAIDGSGDANNDSFFAGVSNGRDKYANWPGDDENRDIANGFINQFQNDHDPWNATGGTRYFNCPVPAVPEADEWLLMLTGLGLVGFLAAQRKCRMTMSQKYAPDHSLHSNFC
jgi:hypothetical protein